MSGSVSSALNRSICRSPDGDRANRTLAIAIDEELANAVGADRGDGDGLHDANLIANKVAFWRKADMTVALRDVR
jgi:hypothetical protein